ncbi:carbon-nitrogen hydrolase family protein [Propionibacteriaceae bacterium Y1923]|uniref:carbon-nitrogen hydrolase family protein n=1 Tax=Aestuariimicrobium sp. Y1814 TaxID=3418742 RepID=UPI003C20F716
MRAFNAAALQLNPAPGPLTTESIQVNAERAVAMIRECVAVTRAELLVLPESVTTGFTPGVSVEELWDLVTEVPGPILTPYQEVAAELGVHLCVGTYRRGEQRGVVYNSAALVGPDGSVLGTYDKTHPFFSESAERGGWVTAGNDVCVVETELGTIGMIICFDGDYPELSRIQAVKGAEVILRPSALLRSADLWELTSRARAYDNHVFVVGANATGIDPSGVIYFGNSHIVTPTANIIARAASHEGWVAARLDPEQALGSLTQGSNIGQGFDHLRDRNLELIRTHRAELEGEARTAFPHSRNAVPSC